MDSIGTLPELYPHQKEGLAYLQKTPKAALFWEMRLGKSKTVIRSLMGIPGRKLIIAPKSVLPVWCDELEAEGVRDYLWFSSEFLKRVTDNIVPILPRWCIVNYEAATRLNLRWRSAMSHIVTDECFNGETLVDTPTGTRKIKDIRPGDMVFNAIGTAPVFAVSIKKLDVSIKITYNSKIIWCSLNHPFLTQDGWVAAQNLQIGDEILTTAYVQKEMSLVQKNIYSSTFKIPFLWNILLGEMENASTRNTRKSVHARTTKKGYQGNKNMVEPKYSRSLQSKRAGTPNGAIPSLSFFSAAEENITDPSSYEMETYSSRWKWKSYPRSSKQAMEIIGKNLDIRISSYYKVMPSKLPLLLQNRYCSPDQKDWDRNRRSHTSGSKDKTKGQEKNKVIKSFRVENIEVYKQRSDGKRGKSARENLFYDLKIDGHPSFSVNGALVHNSVSIKNPQAKITKFLIQNFTQAKRKIVLSGNPAPNTPLEYFSQMQFLYGEWMDCVNYWQFRRRYFVSDLQGWQWWTRHSSKEVIRIELQKRCFFLSRKDVGLENKKVYEKRYVEMPKDVAKKCKEMERDFLTTLPSGEKLETKYVLSQFLYLQELAAGHIKNQKVSDFKIKELINLLEGELKGEQVLIWCRFRWEIASIVAALEKFNPKPLWVHGDIPLELRKYAQDSFNEGATKILVLQISTSRYGLNLAAADTAIFFSNTFSSDDRTQAEARIEHPEKKTSLLYVDLVTKDSIDEDILKALQKKKKESEFFMTVIDSMKERHE